MSGAGGSSQEAAHDAFAEFLELRHEDSSADFEDWLARQPAHQKELRELHAGFLEVERHMPDACDAGDVEAPSESAHPGHEIQGGIGRGAFGRVYRARDRMLKRQVALKVLEPDARLSSRARRRFLEEARILARLDHPNIVRIHSVETVDGEIRLSLELIEGRTLQAIVAEDGPLSGEEAARIGVDLCRALACIHGQGLVHMDVKPGNVMRADGGRIVLLDFGVARSTDPARRTGDEPLGGTPPFMSPEHFERAESVGPRSDVYSLGALLYWLVTGHYPYEFEGIEILREKVLVGAVIPLVDRRPELDPRFVEVVERAMALREEERYASAGEMERALRRLADEDSIARGAERPRRARRYFLASALGLGALLLLVPRLGGPGVGLQLEADLRRIQSHGDEQLVQDAEVQVGDRLYLSARCNQLFYLYVFSEDAEGRCFTLFPPEDSLPLAPDTAHRLPGAAPDDYWEVISPGGGAEHFFVLASAEPHPLGERLRKRIPRPLPTTPGVRFAELPKGEREDVLRGIAEVIQSSRRPAQETLLVDLFEALERQIPSHGATVVKHMRFRAR